MIRVLIAGIGGASLGTEVAKALRAAGGYHIVGCDISQLAYGHYDDVFDATMLVDPQAYVASLLDLCTRHAIAVVIPGGDQPARLIAEQAEFFERAGVALAMNDPAIVARLADKAACFAELEQLGFPIPLTVALDSAEDLRRAPLPCIVKPSLESGGSAFVFYARTRPEIELYASYMTSLKLRPIAQQYIGHEHGEFTVGVLSTRDALIVGTLAMKRAFPAKLSIAAKGADFLISSGYSQGHIGPYDEVCATARAIASAVDSRGPLNIQGRVDDTGRFLPFEINPRFSASTYLRTLAGFNEIDWFVRSLVGDATRPPLDVKPGWYLRSLCEVAVMEGDLKR